MPGGVTLCSTAVDALNGAAALVVATAWPEFRAVPADELVARWRAPAVVDPGGALADTLDDDPRVTYFAVGKGHP
jgi:UDPglucose 6-dehydrogenase